MTPLQQLYWLRVAMGAIAAVICIGYGIVVPSAIPKGEAIPLNTFVNSLTIALAIYLISFYILKSRFISKLEKPQKLVSTGIFMYFITWLVIWILLYTIIAGPPPPQSP
jgi:cellulose synthase/poly-beta-1,6-N-acetylglucosamine synthase-like glycosyltransferase